MGWYPVTCVVVVDVSLRRCVDDWMKVEKGEPHSEESIFGKIIHQVKDFVHPDDKQSSGTR